MNKETINEMKKKLEGAEYGIICTSKGTTYSGNILDLLNVLSNIVNRLNKEIPKELIMYAVNEGLSLYENSKKSESKDDELDKLLKIAKSLKELQ